MMPTVAAAVKSSSTSRRRGLWGPVAIMANSVSQSVRGSSLRCDSACAGFDFVGEVGGMTCALAGSTVRAAGEGVGQAIVRGRFTSGARSSIESSNKGS